MRYFQHNKVSVVFRGLVFIVLGILLVAFPLGALKSVTMFFGIVALISGGVMIINSLFFKKKVSHPDWLLLEGVVNAIFGLILIVKPDITAILISVVIALWAVISGFMQLFRAMAKRKRGMKVWILQFLVGFMLLIIGIYILFNPLTVSATLAIWIGIILIGAGVLHIAPLFTSGR